MDKASAVYALKLTGAGYSSATFTADARFTQTVGVGSTAIGRVVSYDSTTGVLKYWQDRSLVGFNTDGSQNTVLLTDLICLDLLQLQQLQDQ